MGREIKDTELAKEIKKDYLMQHLEEVKRLASAWTGQLGAPSPFTPNWGVFGWQSRYRPVIEEDPDSVHMLRRHLRSRALWAHHATWERSLDLVWGEIQELRGIVRHTAKGDHGRFDSDEERNFVGTATWEAFLLSLGRDTGMSYVAEDGSRGVSYGPNYRIDATALDSQEKSSVQREHEELISSLKKCPPMEGLVQQWREVLRVQEHMKLIATKLLKSSDILHACRFCRHLWK